MKQTEIGLIPDDWEVKRLNAICNNICSGKNQNRFVNGIYPVYGSTGIIGFCNNNKYSGDAILVARVGANAGLVNKVAGKYDVSDNTLGIQSDKCDIDYLSRLLAFRNLNQLIFASGQPLITGGQLKALLIQLPSLTEQQRIAKALSDVDALIFTTEKLLQKKRNIKQGTMQELLTGKKRLPGFGPQTQSPTYKQTELGLIPEDWEVKTLNELINDISDGPFGSNLKTEHYTTEREVRIIQLSNVGEDGWDNENVKYTTFTHAKEIQRCIVPYGSIVIAKMMPAGRAILCPNKEKMYILGSDCVRISPNNLLDSLFFMYFSKTSFYLNQIKENTQGSTRARTSVSKLKRIEIALPQKKEQISIAKILSDMDNEIDLLNKKLEKYRNLKTAMMQQLLTGKIRLIK
jgi:type I restriction enzyme S subunit